MLLIVTSLETVNVRVIWDISRSFLQNECNLHTYKNEKQNDNRLIHDLYQMTQLIEPNIYLLEF